MNKNYFINSSLFGLFQFLICILVSSGCASGSTVTDIDGNEYPTIKIGDQWWTAENLKVTHYNNGEPIPHVTDGEEWSNLITGAYSAYGNDPDNIPVYGLLYNWYAADDSRGICPQGWHTSSDEDWMELELLLGIEEIDLDRIAWRGEGLGEKLKDTESGLWTSNISDQTNETGFSIVPSGGRTSDPAYGGDFFYQGIHSAIWTSDEMDDRIALFRAFWNNNSGIKRNYYNKGNGFSIRCVKD